MVNHSVFSLDETTRRSWYNPEQILQTAGLHSGMIFMDIGSADGFFTVLAAKMVGEKGKVYALDIDEATIRTLKSNVQKAGLKNVQAVVGAAEETVICRECADMIFFSMVLHDFQDPAKVLLNARKMINPKGLLVNLDWEKQEDKTAIGPPLKIRFSEEKACSMIEAAGFKCLSPKHVGPYHYVLTGKPLMP